MTTNPEIPVFKSPFLDEVFFNSPLCQICEYASLFGGVCSLLLNRRLPVNFVVKQSQIVSCSAHRNWLQTLDDDEDSSFWEEFIDLGEKQSNQDLDPG